MENIIPISFNITHWWALAHEVDKYLDAIVSHSTGNV
jgi:hypothetical protein